MHVSMNESSCETKDKDDNVPYIWIRMFMTFSEGCGALEREGGRGGECDQFHPNPSLTPESIEMFWKIYL